jgi:hypothetical protein
MGRHGEEVAEELVGAIDEVNVHDLQLSGKETRRIGGLKLEKPRKNALRMEEALSILDVTE